MKKVEIAELFEIKNELIKPLFEGKVYPWEDFLKEKSIPGKYFPI